MKIVYITGCLGFIGRYVTQLLLDEGYYVYGIDSCTYASEQEILERWTSNPKFKFEKRNICDIDRLVDCDFFINIAAETHVDNSIRDSRVFLDSNVVGIYNILEHLKIYKKEGYNIPRLIHFSTDEVYGTLGDEGKFTESTPYDPNSPYSASKASSDHFVRAYHETFKLPIVISNCSNNYGSHQFPEKLIPLFIHNIKNKITIF